MSRIGNKPIDIPSGVDIKIEKEIDLVISLKSMGYHYPFELYLKLFNKCCNNNTIYT